MHGFLRPLTDRRRRSNGTRLLGVLVAALLAGSAFPAPLAAQRAAAAPDSIERRRLRRIETLADIWTKLELFHPALQLRADIQWDSAFVRALPRVESARTTAEFVRAIDEELFARLEDPLSFAITQEDADRREPNDVPGTGLVRQLAPGVAYIDLYVDSSIPLAPAVTFATRVEAALREHASTHGAPELLVADLRWQRKDSPFIDQVLALWATHAVPTGMRVSRLHRGFYTPSRWQVEPGGTLARSPAIDSLGPIRTPTVFLVNRNSLTALQRPLDALQRLPNVAVALENRGPMAEGWEVLTYPELVRVRIDSPKLVSTDGALGVRPDTVIGARIRGADLATVARATLQKAASRGGRAAFTFPFRPRPRYALDSAPPERGMRILGLVRLWKEVGTFSAYLPYARIDLSRALPVWIPEVERSTTMRDYYLTLRRLVALLDDSHAGVEHPTVNAPPWTIPATLRRAGAHVLVMHLDSSLKSNDLAVGDEILAVNGVPVRAVEDSLRRYRSASHPGPHYRNVWEYAEGVRGPRDTPVRLTVNGARGRRDVTLRRSVDFRTTLAVLPHPDSVVRRLPGNVGYIAMNGLASESMFDSALVTLASTDALVLDMRMNIPRWSGGSNPDMRNLLVSRFLAAPVDEPKGGIHDVFMHGGPPVRALGEQVMTYVPFANDNGIRYEKPIAVLIGPRNQSAAESTIWQLKLSGRALFVGESTAGTNGGAPEASLPGGGLVIFTHERVTYPGNQRFHGIGIVPDIPVIPTVAGVRAGRDEVLERAAAALRTGRKR